MIILIYCEIDRSPAVCYPVTLPDAFRLIRGFTLGSLYSWTLKRDEITLAEVR